jgi:hypothetical protein
VEFDLRGLKSCAVKQSLGCEEKREGLLLLRLAMDRSKPLADDQERQLISIREQRLKMVRQRILELGQVTLGP